MKIFNNKIFKGVSLFLCGGVILFFACIAFAYNLGTDFTLCNGSVDQDTCYFPDDYATPTLNWTVNGTSWQESYQIQIDDDAGFASPEIDTGWMVSTDKTYDVSSSGLGFETLYYWRIRIEDNQGSISSWVSDSFTTNRQCLLESSDMEVTQGDYCTLAAHYFSWVYSDPEGKDQSRFRFQVDNDADFSSPVIDRDYTGLSNSNLATNNQTVLVAEIPTSDQLAYNTTYYWRVMVWNSDPTASSWSEGSSFSTELHRYPSVSFDYDPSIPDYDEDIQFLDTSTVYGGATKSSWSWTFEDGVPVGSSEQNPVVVFSSRGTKEITLEVTDSDGFSCGLPSGSGSLDIRQTIPNWREVLPW